MTEGFCGNCGEALGASQRYCRSCGAELPSASEIQAGGQDPSPPHLPPLPGGRPHYSPPEDGAQYGTQFGHGPEMYDATPGVVMGIIAFVLGGVFLHVPALVMGMRGRAAPSNRNANASFWLGVVGLVWDVLLMVVVFTILLGSEEEVGALVGAVLPA